MSGNRIALTGARLCDGENAPRDGVTVVVEGNRIAGVGEEPAPSADRVIELEGRTLMPGMFSGHFHSGFGHFGAGISAPMLGLEAPAAFYGMLAAHNAQVALKCGFTSVIGSSNGDGLDVCLKEAIRRSPADRPDRRRTMRTTDPCER
jgi:imidazolonepropionase-like amidohydrolase